MSNKLTGVFAPVVTPFKADLSPDFELYLQHCQWLLQQGAGLAVFGTNSEANSLTTTERMDLLDRLVQHGVDSGRMLPGTGCCTIQDTVELSRHATVHGCAGVLMLPPFFYKGVTDDGLFDYYSEVIERVALQDLRVYLYHIPAFSGVPISLALIERLIRRYPQQVAGIKDSSGDWQNIEAMLTNFPDFAIFPASESFLTRAMPLGASGCISATINVNPAAISRLCTGWRTDGAVQQQQELDTVRKIFQSYPMIAALKFAISHYRDHPSWQIQRPPLSALAADKKSALIAALDAAGFSMPGLLER
ncbi:dihydrodipicolinate synthase family protein [Undibacterium sp.]|jgi:4-hydroxy-tetrahydrodipicolinate synthase|uniref:dihydrodipicolinate synthase family protein n=1 Tax=Undibacterium sp. TaxID=1914977 RepID=UPI002C3A7F24|nr:dihydrodipicolinate synthase family protein [Undibacterium sp.]HTD05050.1 dihydrodipicolinate synthase family protein [Undibacterium sp.]